MHKGKSVSPNQFARSFARTVRNAWRDLSVRRPGDPAFRSAWRLRHALTERTEAHPTAPNVVPDVVPDTAPAKASRKANKKAIKNAIKKARQQAALPAPPEPARNVTPGPLWDLPERRKFKSQWRPRRPSSTVYHPVTDSSHSRRCNRGRCAAPRPWRCRHGRCETRARPALRCCCPRCRSRSAPA